MDAATPSASPTAASKAPLHIGALGLGVRDLDRMTAFYRDVIGLAVIERSDNVARLGAGEVAILELMLKPDAKPDDPHEAGLYHTAFLMPARADLAQWILHIAQSRVPIAGASDHGVSEAFYLDDPEGNGVEVYSDRPRERWQYEGGMVSMPTVELDIEDIVREATPAVYSGAPAGLRIGHVHLRVGDVALAEKFYRDALGLDVTRRRNGASFMSSGGYHHHVAGNVWHSQGAGARDQDRTGLSWFTIETDSASTLDAAHARLQAAGVVTSATAHGFEARDPWGTRVRLAKPS